MKYWFYCLYVEGNVVDGLEVEVMFGSVVFGNCYFDYFIWCDGVGICLCKELVVLGKWFGFCLGGFVMMFGVFDDDVYVVCVVIIG